MEYIQYAMEEANGKDTNKNAKKIVLYLSKHREREVDRDEIGKELALGMSDSDLEKKLKILVNADIIDQGGTNVDYRGVADNIFDKVFRGVYQKEIEAFDPREITNEYKALFAKLFSRRRFL